MISDKRELFISHLRQSGMHIPNFGPYEMTMVLVKTDSGYEGTVSDTIGYIAEDTIIQELKVESNQLSCWFEMTDDSVCDNKKYTDRNHLVKKNIGEPERCKSVHRLSEYGYGLFKSEH